MRMIAVALALLALTPAVSSQPAVAEELRLRRVNEHRLVIEGPFGERRGYVRETPSGRLVIENEWGRRVGSVRPAPGGGRAIVEWQAYGVGRLVRGEALAVEARVLA